MDYSIEAFVDKLLQEKGVTGLPAEVMEQLKADLVERAENLVNAEILASMPESALEDFEKKLDAGDEEELRKFCQANIPNMEEVVAGALIKLQNIYQHDGDI
ncbi:MAG: DUF5663 domain-containing protein [Candidatus Paceibacterota bacterium]|jgi:hypothetical protein